MTVLVALAAIFGFMMAGWVPGLLGVCAYLLLEISLDVKRMYVCVGDTYTLLTKQVQDAETAEALEEIEEALAKGQSADHFISITWPPSQN